MHFGVNRFLHLFFVQNIHNWAKFNWNHQECTSFDEQSMNIKNDTSEIMKSKKLFLAFPFIIFNVLVENVYDLILCLAFVNWSPPSH